MPWFWMIVGLIVAGDSISNPHGLGGGWAQFGLGVLIFSVGSGMVLTRRR